MRPASKCAVSEVRQRIRAAAQRLQRGFDAHSNGASARGKADDENRSSAPRRSESQHAHRILDTELRPPGGYPALIGKPDAKTVEKFLIRVTDQFIAELRRLICLVCGGAIPPAVRERFDHIHEFLAGDTPPVQNQVMVGCESDFANLRSCSTTFAL